jgi:bile acid:Na+ symporter, BASS family
MSYEVIVQTAAGFAVFSLMFVMGTTLVMGDFRRLLDEPKPVVVGLLGQFVALPLVAFAIAYFLKLPDYIAIGLILIAACPGGTTSNAFSFMARGDVALSVILTSVSSLFAFVTIPFILPIALEFFSSSEATIALSFWEVATSVFLSTALPLVIGMTLRHFQADFCEKIRKPIFNLSFLVLMVPAVVTVVSFKDMYTPSDFLYSLSALALNVIMVAIGYGLGWMAKFSPSISRTIAIEIGIQNYGLAILLALVFLKDPRFLLAGSIYLPSMFLTGFAIVFLAKLQKDQVPRADIG